MDSKVLIWNSGGTRGFELKGHTASISDIAVSSCSKYVFSSSYDKSIKLWSTKTPYKNILTFNDHKNPILNIKLCSTRNDYMLSGDRGGIALLSNINTGKKMRIFSGHKGHVSCINFFPQTEVDDYPLCLTGDQQGLSLSHTHTHTHSLPPSLSLSLSLVTLFLSHW